MYEQIIFVTGIGTDVGKTVVSAVLARALEADYWKPVQAGFDQGTDSQWVAGLLGEKRGTLHPEVYRLALPASPHIAARQEGIRLSVQEIVGAFRRLRPGSSRLVVEGAGGLLVPLNDREFVADLAAALATRVVLVSRHYLGSINHSLLTAAVCRQKSLPVGGWIFNDQAAGLEDYQEDIVSWSGYPKLGAVPRLDQIDSETVARIASLLQPGLASLIHESC
ncbi:MAG TPA: dethiobiotin synthase [Chitinophagaceae bacterium]|nr:dethiobiotin synthase [Chitinophagaceae bacterium]